MAALDRINRGSLVDGVMQQLRSLVTAGEWRVGERIPVENELSARMGVGRNTVREAVRVLVHAGMLETRQGDGTYVRARTDPVEALRRIDRAGLRDLVEVRLMLEAEAARLAALRHTRADLAAMRKALHARAKAGVDVRDRIGQDARFHRAVVTAAHNRALADLYDYFADAIVSTIVRTEVDMNHPAPSHAGHARLLTAVAACDSTGAAAAARELLAPYLAALSAPPVKA